MSKFAFGLRLKRLREEASLSQAELGRRAGVGANTISNLEAGNRQPQWVVVVKLARALGVSTDLFLPQDNQVEEEEPEAALASIY